MDIDRLRAELFLLMAKERDGDLSRMPTEEAMLLGEHAARLARSFMQGVEYFDRTGNVRDPKPPRVED